MLYLNSISNQQASIGRKFAICHEEVEGMPNIPQLAPSGELWSDLTSQKIGFDDFKRRFLTELREEYRKPDSKLKGLAGWGKNNDGTLHSPEEDSEGSYRCVLAEAIEGIWKRQDFTQTIADLTAEEKSEETVAAELEIDEELEFVDIAKNCEFFSPILPDDKRIDCSLCEHYDKTHYCKKKKVFLVEYHWE